MADAPIWTARYNPERQIVQTKADWATPWEHFFALEYLFGKRDFDHAADADNAKCANFYTRDDDAIIQSWHGHGWLNPPFGKAADEYSIFDWLTKVMRSIRTGTLKSEIVLLPGDFERDWFEATWEACALQKIPATFCLCNPRINFVGSKTSNPTSSIVMFFGELQAGYHEDYALSVLRRIQHGLTYSALPTIIPLNLTRLIAEYKKIYNMG